MKRNIKLKKIMLTVCIGSLGLSSFVQALPNIQNENLIEQVVLKKKTLTTYRTNNSLNLDKASVQKRMVQLEDYLNVNMNNREVKNRGNKLVVKNDNGNSFIEIDSRSGNFLYKGDMTKYNSEETTANLLGKKETVKMFYTHLNNLDLMPKKEELGTIEHTGLSMSVRKENGKSFDYKKTTAVMINRKLDGLPVQGSSRIFINMGSNGEISNMVYKWPAIEKSTTIASKNVINADVLKKSIVTQLEKRAAKASKITLEKINLVMYDNGKGLIEPAYYVEAKLFFKDGKSSYNTPYDFYIPAINNPQIVYPLMSKPPVQPMKADKKADDNTIMDNNE